MNAAKMFINVKKVGYVISVIGTCFIEWTVVSSRVPFEALSRCARRAKSGIKSTP